MKSTTDHQTSQTYIFGDFNIDSKPNRSCIMKHNLVLRISDFQEIIDKPARITESSRSIIDINKEKQKT